MIIFTKHALKRMRERKISKAEIISTIRQSDFKEEENNEIRTYYKKFHNKTLEVVAEIKRNKIIIIT